MSRKEVTSVSGNLVTFPCIIQFKRKLTSVSGNLVTFPCIIQFKRKMRDFSNVYVINDPKGSD